ncbi:sulfurtransferase [Pseudomonas sp. LRF_L74]|uniref:sulfurtransferase n=1 Tax=Pseudomonas sp. LRF_L74 TaxID=3369422 RepID=UPI003F5F0EC6
MPIAQLLTAEQLGGRLDDPELIILDCRFALEDPEYGARSHAAGHIPGAHFADLEKHLSGPLRKGFSGRHPLPSVEAFISAARGWGINDDSTVVLYDDGPGAFAARAWWLLAWLGKRDGVFLLDGGLKAWKEADLPLTTATPQSAPGQFDGKPDNELLINAEQLHLLLGDPDLTLLDARALPRFRGDVEPLDPVAGHIPGAQCAVFTDNLGPDGRFLPAGTLRQRFDTLRGERPREALVAYCGSGVTACHNLFALSLAGYPLTPLYAGSWSEWITDEQRPVAKGD